MDRRRAAIVRSLCVAGTAVLIGLALWSSGLPLDEWWQGTIGQRAEEKGSEIARPHSDATSGVHDASSAHTPLGQTQLPGTDSSVTAIPQPLYLISIAAARNDLERTAQIGTAPSNPQTYSVGAILVNGARLAEIRADHVVLERDSKRHSLYLHDDAHPKPSAPLAFVGGSATQSPPEKLSEDRLTEVIRAMPVYENGMLSGLQAFPGRSTAAFAQLGLQADDVIVALNGAPLADLQAAVDVLRMLTEGAALTASVRRHGAVVTVALDGTIVVRALAPPPRTEMLAEHQ